MSFNTVFHYSCNFLLYHTIRSFTAVHFVTHEQSNNEYLLYYMKMFQYAMCMEWLLFNLSARTDVETYPYHPRVLLREQNKNRTDGQAWPIL